MISTGLHDNMKMSQKLHQNGNSETGSHEALSEPTLLHENKQRSQPCLQPTRPFMTEDSENLQGRRDPWSPLPMHFAISKYINKSWIHYLTRSHVNSTYTFADLVCPAASREWVHLFLQTVVACNPECQRRACHQKSVKTSNYMRPGPQLTQSDRAPRNPWRHDDAV